MCGGPNNASIRAPPKFTIHGDLLNTDTRAVLVILEYTQVEHAFKESRRSKEMMKNLGQLYDGQFSIDYISKVCPVLENEGVKSIGSG